MLEGNYDLFFFDLDCAGDDEGNGEWRNHKYYVQNGLDFKVPDYEDPYHPGYLYANGSNTTLSFQGAIRTEAAWENKRIHWGTNSVDFRGFNLLGNPYPCNATLSFGNRIDTDQIYMMKEDGQFSMNFIYG